MEATDRPLISAMVAVPDAAAAVAWYREALGAQELWNRGSVVGLEIAGAPFFLAEPANNGWDSREGAGTTTVRIELFTDDPDGMIGRPLATGARAIPDGIRDHEAPWGRHHQGGFWDPLGHLWLVGDRSPLQRWRP